MGDTFASWLNAQMNAHNLSARKVALKVGVSHTTIVRLANGQVAPSPEMCQDLARVFGVSVEEVFRLAGLLPPASSNEPGTAGLLRRLDAMDPVARQEAIDLVTRILDYYDRRTVEPAPVRSKRNRASKRAAPLSDQVAQLQKLFEDVPEEDQDEVLQRLSQLRDAANERRASQE